jgi:hypothetical protein
MLVITSYSTSFEENAAVEVDWTRFSSERSNGTGGGRLNLTVAVKLTNRWVTLVNWGAASRIFVGSTALLHGADAKRGSRLWEGNIYAL